MPRKNWQRATGDDEKAIRSQKILDSALKLFEKHPDVLPSVTEIAKASGLAKGTVYLYFETKEEIFLALLSRKYAQWTHLMSEALSKAREERDERARLRQFRDAVAGYCISNETFLRLACRSQSILEQNLTPDVALKFKTALAAQVQAVGEGAERAFPKLAAKPGAGAKMLLGTYALIVGFWQISDVPKGLAHLQTVDGLAHLFPDFKAEIGHSLEAYWIGYLNSLSS